MNQHKIILSLKKIVFGKTESYKFFGKNLNFLTGTRPIKRKYISSQNDVVRNDVLQINYFEENFKPHDVLWDIGSHNGHYSIFAAAIAAGNNQVFSFEPDETAFQMQTKNIAANSLQEKIRLVNIAVAGENGTLLFNSQNGNSNSHIVKDFSEEVATVTKVTAKTINTLLEEIPRPTFVKIDTEGAEIDILRNANDLLLDKNIRFICELHPFAWKSFRVEYSEFEMLMQKYGREIKLIDTNKEVSNLPFYATVLF